MSKMVDHKENSEIVQVGSKVYLFPRLPNETDKVYYGRRKFIMSSSPSTQKKYLSALRLSMVWANINYLGCSYPEEVVNEVKELMKTF